MRIIFVCPAALLVSGICAAAALSETAMILPTGAAVYSQNVRSEIRLESADAALTRLIDGLAPIKSCLNELSAFRAAEAAEKCL